MKDEPVAYWRFSQPKFAPQVGAFSLKPIGKASVSKGAKRPDYPRFLPSNRAFDTGGGKGYLRVTDPGRNSPFDFESGDPITIEAWVAPTSIASGFAYIISKGRTYLPGQVKENHNWAIRLQGSGGSAQISFLFRSRGKGSEYHRWTSQRSFAVGDGWHHVAVSYRFGDPKTIRGVIDGKVSDGKWDLGGATGKAPIVDDDEVWIGSAMGGNRNSSFRGQIDEVAIYRSLVPVQHLKQRYAFRTPPPLVVKVPKNRVLVQLFRGAGSWNSRRHVLIDSFQSPLFAFDQVPHRYSPRGIQVDRPVPLLLQAHADVTIPKGIHRLLVRAREMSRLYVDDKLVAETKPYSITVEANGPIWDLDRSHGPEIRPLRRGDRQAVAVIEGDGKVHRLRFETFAGLKQRRPEFGEASVSIGKEKGGFEIVGFGQTFPLTNHGWRSYRDWNHDRMMSVNQQNRAAAGKGESIYWQQRHRYAAKYIADKRSKTGLSERSIDDWVNKHRKQHNQVPPARISDLAFLKRLCLDIVGKVPTRAQIDHYLKLKPGTRRREMIDYLLADPGWADHWVAYWQDVLAENPNVVNPSLNNTGPFRWWIYESFWENKPIDRFVTELIRMEGSIYFGGPAGFSLATENDVPMAAKAHIIGQAFLGVQMQCARCHDAPNHDVAQKDLFALAALLKRGAEEVPKTSSIDLSPDQLGSLAVEVTLKPGSKVKPQWTLQRISPGQVPPGLIKGKEDSREQLAGLLTMPQNERFAQVIVNRLWKRYLGRGLVEPVHDWEGQVRTHPALLAWLADELVAHQYDLKHIARLIFNSDIYHREAVTDPAQLTALAGPATKPLTAEQLVDSLFGVAGKRFRSGPMAIDIDGARPKNLSLNLGVPRRAWMFTSTSNERDRPGLAMPFVQPFVTFLEQFGWRGARQNPINQRPDAITALQPAEFANGVLVQRITRLSDDHQLTAVAMRDIPLKELVAETYLHILARRPTKREAMLIQQILTVNYEKRRQPDAPIQRRPPNRQGTISWSNHLEELATTIKVELESVVRRGDPATRKLRKDWRERYEDVIWSLLNSPEFRFSP